MSNIRMSVAEMKQKVLDGKITRYKLAKFIGMNINSIRKMTEDDWNPTLDTLIKIERIMNEIT